MGWVGVGVLPSLFRRRPPHAVVLCCCLGAREAGWGRESLTPLPVNNDVLLGADPSGVSHQEGQPGPAKWRRKRWSGAARGLWLDEGLPAAGGTPDMLPADPRVGGLQVPPLSSYIPRFSLQAIPD